MKARKQNNQTDDDGLAARRAALRGLGCILDDGLTLDDTLHEILGRAEMADRDRAFTHQLLATTLRRLGHADHALKAYLQKPIPKRAREAGHILQLGAAQILFLNVAPHAAVDTSVALAATSRDPNTRRLKGLINAVLRRLGEQRAGLLEKAEANPLGSWPRWLQKSWLAHFGEEAAQAIARACLTEPPLDLSLRSSTEAGTLAEALGGQILPTGSLRLMTTGDIRALPGFAEGRWWVQDAAAALPVRLLGNVEGLDVADLCAAPGGKALQLAAAGARVTAVDISAKRLKRLEENLSRTRLSADVMTSDILKWRPHTAPDVILLDAPCSATGTLRRHPDVARLKGPGDIRQLAELQTRMLDHAFAVLKPGGTMIYCVCSLQAAEGADQIGAFLSRTPGAVRAPVLPAELPGLPEALTEDGDVQTLPSMWTRTGGLDGFFISRICKAKT